MDQEILYRTGTIYRDVIDEESRTIELSFSSDAAVERVFGNEVLEHIEDSMDSQVSVSIYFSFRLPGGSLWLVYKHGLGRLDCRMGASG